MPKGSGRTKNLRYGGANMVDLFGDAEDLSMPEGLEVDDLEDVYEIDIDLIAKDANTLAASNVQNLLRLYNNKQFTDEHPDFKRRIDTEIESLRKLYKMAKVNEEVHDHLVHAIAKKPSNASLYMSLDRVQGKILAIDAKIREQIATFNKIITGFQMELNFAQDNDLTGDPNQSSELEDGSVLSRGGKAFVEQMKARASKESNNNDGLDPDNLPVGWKVDEETGEVIDEDTGEVMGMIRKDS